MNAANVDRRLFLLALFGIAPFMVNGLVNSVIAHNALLYWGFELLTWVIIPSVVLYLVWRTPGIGFRDLGYHWSLRGRYSPPLLVLACLLFAPLDYAVYRNTYDYFSGLLPNQGFFNYESIVPDSGLLYYLVVIYFALSAGLVEEFLYRGLLYRALSGMPQAIPLFLVISPLLFGFAHWEDGVANLVSTWLVGIFMALAYLGFRNLWPLVIGHVFTDLVWFS